MEEGLARAKSEQAPERLGQAKLETERGRINMMMGLENLISAGVEPPAVPLAEEDVLAAAAAEVEVVGKEARDAGKAGEAATKP